MTKWERAKLARREAIFDAARALYRSGENLVTADRIARRAGVATATVYNLVGPREELLGALLDDVFSRLGEALRGFEGGDPLVFGEAVVVESARLFCEDSELWRGVFHDLSGGASRRLSRKVTPRPVDLQIKAMTEAGARGQLRPGVDPEAAAWQIYASYNGGLFLWVGGTASNEAFQFQGLFGYWTVLAALGSEATRAGALARLVEMGSPSYPD